MKVFVKANPNAREESVVKIDDEHFIVAVKEPPMQGRANAAIVKVLANYFDLSATEVRIISGQTSRNKIVEIET